MSVWQKETAIARHLLAALALLALAFTIAVPPGFMVHAGSSFPIVVCTGHGPATIAFDGHGRPTKAPANRSDHVCPFAGNGAVPFAPNAAFAGRPLPVSHGIAVVLPIPDMVPGRGLAAPPPPSHAPPAALA